MVWFLVAQIFSSLISLYRSKTSSTKIPRLKASKFIFEVLIIIHSGYSHKHSILSRMEFLNDTRYTMYAN